MRRAAANVTHHPLGRFEGSDATAEFKTVRFRLVKCCRRIIETVTRVRVGFTPSFPRPSCSAASRADCSPPGHDRLGQRPNAARSARQNPRPTTHRCETAMKYELGRAAPAGQTTFRAATDSK